MPVHYSLPLKQARMSEVITALDAHPTIEAYVEISTGNQGPSPPWSFDTPPLVRVNFEDPSFDAPDSNGSISMHVTPPKTSLDGIGTGNGLAAVARLCDGSGTIIADGLIVGTTAQVTAGTHHIGLSALNVNAGQTVSITAGRITHAP